MRKLVGFAILIAVAAAQQAPSGAIGEVHGTDATVRGAVTVGATTTTVMSGSQVSAGTTPATIKLTRGGELKVCSASSITITASATGREALVGLNSGSIETRYRLGPNADTIVTPDFRLQLPGPGDFYFAVGVRSTGDMCVKSLPGNGSAVIVNEVFGDGTHQVRPGEALVFQKGTVQNAVPIPAGDDCGCTTAAKATELGFPEQQSQQAAAAIAAGQPPPTTAPLPGVSANRNEVITKVDAPIVFRGEDVGKTPRVAANSEPPSEKPTPAKVEPPAAPKAAEVPTPALKPVKKKWFQKLGSAIANIFR
jgi:hypothetical protein